MKSIYDYITFLVLFMIGIILVAYSKIKAKNSSKQDYAFATGTVSSVAVLLSIARTGMGIRLFLGIPADFYYHGAEMWETLFGVCSSFFIVSILFMPVYFAMPTTSIYQYLELRFHSSTVRNLTSLIYLSRSLMMLGLSMLTPCIAVYAVTGIPYWITVLSLGLFSSCYIAIGGMRGIILNDVLQSLIMLGCTLIIIIKASFTLSGGLISAFEIASEKGRLDFFKFDLDPTKRVTIVSGVIGQMVSSTALYGCQQGFAQKYRSLSSQKKAVKVLLFTGPIVVILESLLWVAGVVVFATYADCDPLTSGKINTIDEILPFYMQNEFVSIPGMSGLFIACIFNGSLGVTVTILNSMSTVIWEDFVSKFQYMKDLKEGKQLITIRLTGCLFGFIVMGMALLISNLPGLVETSLLISSVSNGPMLGVFLLALLFPFVNKIGAISGIIIGVIFTSIMTTGRLILSKASTTLLPVSIEKCEDIISNITFESTKYILANDDERPVLNWYQYLFSITFMYYSLMGCTVCVTIGILVSLITESKNNIYEEKLIHPFAIKISNIMPGKKRTYLKKRGENNNAFDYVTYM